MEVFSAELLSNFSIRFYVFAFLQHQGFAFLQRDQWVQEGPVLVPGVSKAQEVIWEEWGEGEVIKGTMISESWLSLMEKMEAERTEGDILVSSKHRLSLMSGYIVSFVFGGFLCVWGVFCFFWFGFFVVVVCCCFCFVCSCCFKKLFLQCQICILFGSGVWGMSHYFVTVKGVKFCYSQSGLHTEVHKGNNLCKAKKIVLNPKW